MARCDANPRAPEARVHAEATLFPVGSAFLLAKRIGEFFIARDETTRMALAATTPYAAPAKLAPCVIAVCTRTEGLRFPRCTPLDMSAAVENILLEAANIGLGAVWLGIAPEPDRIAAVKVALGGPREVEPFALVAVGHALNHPEPKGSTRYDETRVHWI